MLGQLVYHQIGDANVKCVKYIHWTTHQETYTPLDPKDLEATEGMIGMDVHFGLKGNGIGSSRTIWAKINFKPKLSHSRVNHLIRLNREKKRAS